MNKPLSRPDYMPGLHIICDFESGETDKLKDATTFEKFLNELISEYKLQRLGEVYYGFPNAGFTAVVCLTESHIAIHTWPEYQKATFDVFLSNYMRVNDGHARAIADKILLYFNSGISTITEIKR